jgi:glyceraldehyde 3-phosphate dehydrogenase
MKVLEDKIGIVKALMTTIHAYTADQNLIDGSHKGDMRRARAAALNMVPTATGAAKAVGKVMPSIKGKFDGLAIRVPVACGSISDIVFIAKRKTSIEEVNKILEEAAKTTHKGIIEASHEPLVSSDIVGNPASCIVDLEFTKVVEGDLVKILAWYDNEWGYSMRLVEQAVEVGKRIK